MKNVESEIERLLAEAEERKKKPMLSWSDSDFNSAEELSNLKKDISPEILVRFGVGEWGIDVQRNVDEAFEIPYIPGESQSDRAKRIAVARGKLDKSAAERLRIQHDIARGEIVARQNNKGCLHTLMKSFKAFATGE